MVKYVLTKINLNNLNLNIYDISLKARGFDEDSSFASDKVTTEIFNLYIKNILDNIRRGLSVIKYG